MLINLETYDFIFAGFTAASFLSAYILNKFLLNSLQHANLDNLNFLSKNLDDDLKKSEAVKNSIKKHIKLENNDYQFDYNESKLNDLNLIALRKVENNSDFLKNWLIIDMDDVISKINNIHPGESSETAANSWPFYIFLRLLSNYPDIILKVSGDKIENNSLTSLFKILLDFGDFTNDDLIEYKNYSMFVKYFLSRQTNNSVDLLLNILKNIHDECI